MREKIKARVVRVATFHGPELAGGGFGPDHHDEIDARRQSDDVIISCYRFEIDEVPYADHGTVNVTTEDDDTDVEIVGRYLATRVGEHGIVEILVEADAGGAQEWYPATRVWPVPASIHDAVFNHTMEV